MNKYKAWLKKNAIPIMAYATIIAYYIVCTLIIYAMGGYSTTLTLIALIACAAGTFFLLKPSGLYGVHSLVGVLAHARKGKTGGAEDVPT